MAKTKTPKIKPGAASAKAAAKNRAAQEEKQQAQAAAAAAQQSFDFGKISRAKEMRLSELQETISENKQRMDKARGNIGNAYKEIEEGLGLDRQGIKAAQKVADMEPNVQREWLSSFFIGLKVAGVEIDIRYGTDAAKAASSAGKAVAAHANGNGQATNGHANGNGEETEADVKAAFDAGVDAGTKGKGTRPSNNKYDFDKQPKQYDAFDKGWDSVMAGRAEKMREPASTTAH